MLIAPTSDDLRFHKAVLNLVPTGTVDVTRSIQKSQLALKHRSNKNQKQRIILFIAHPLRPAPQTQNPELNLVPIGKNLKKNNIAIDIVSFGAVSQNNVILSKLIQAANANSNSHLVEVPLGEVLLSTALMRSGTLFGGPVATNDLGLDVDPNADPDLYMALQMSLQEEEARRRQADRPSEALPEPEEGGSRTPLLEDIFNMDIDEDLRNALILSLQETGAATPDDDSELAAAIALSRQLNEDEEEKKDD
ncbi:MAG: LOW QUALITY PROTEIN: hypothetical protein KVP17_005070 [Porospora cf. gigantea B]|uniref:uncharacterized protein n=1 Tax=Porospora cf. gigantea B TaxID=2853592 RepID=UPI003571EE41|nr:MAG: LOW QUALITY PROTEIN: hypothetical protein KVP17_005070 [Porospora cf. gigantea B]